MSLLLFGPPGAGKGTQSSFLIDRRKMKHISTGDLFRNAIKAGTPLGLQAKGFMDQGNLVPDKITIGLIREVLAGLKGGDYVLDGFPRNVPQAEALESLLKEMTLNLDHVVFLDVPSALLVSRLTGRRVCKNCGATYHVEAQMPKSPGVCDNCGGEVIQRSDDKRDVIENRLMVYEKNTAPLREYYGKRGLMVTVDGTGTAEEVYGRLGKVLDKRG